MELKILGSESSGNGYILQAENETLLIEAGVCLQFVKQAMNYNLENIVGFIISHEHGDHSKYAKDYAKTGIDIYTSKETIDATGCTGHRFNAMVSNLTYDFGHFIIFPFDVPHGGVKCFGYLIVHPEMGKLVFITDAAYVPVKFKGLNQICIEVNYDDPLLQSDRAVGKHLSLDTALAFLRANDLSHVHNIILLHLSSSNSDSRAFVKAVKEVASNSNVVVADRGLQIELNRNPF
jgi:phosphoribosyl 1,2-cyclic phosphodiesterase